MTTTDHLNTPDNSLVHYHHPDPVLQTTVQSWLFAELLPWQKDTWQYFTNHYQNPTKALPHAILIGGNAGTGKRAFVYRFVAWAFCQNNQKHDTQTACGHCESCQWLIANTHPNLYQLPKPLLEAEKSPKKNQILDESPTHQATTTIKIDDIRTMQPFVQQSSHGVRIVVIHQADQMTLGASNALLKTLEEPADNVLMFLLSDTPSQLLPTIRSRLQSFKVSHILPHQSLDFMQNQLPNAHLTDLEQVNHLSAYAPFVAMDMLHSQWYQHRQMWINSWQAVRSGNRTPIQASNYWQKNLSLSDFLYLSQIMLIEVGYIVNQLPSLQSDLNWDKLQPMPKMLGILSLQNVIEQIWQDRRQHIQDKLCYDKLINAMQLC